MNVLKITHNEIKPIEIENTLEALQREVGGYIETVYLGDNYILICDEEGKLKALNCITLVLRNKKGQLEEIVGNCLIMKVSKNGETFKGLNKTEIEYFMNDLKLQMFRCLDV